MIIFFTIPFAWIIVAIIAALIFGALLIQNLASVITIILVAVVCILFCCSIFEEYGAFSSVQAFFSYSISIVYMIFSSYLMVKYVRLSGRNGAIGFFFFGLILYVLASLFVMFMCQITQKVSFSFVSVSISLLIILLLGAWSNGYTNVSKNEYKIDNVDYVVVNSDADYTDETRNVGLLFEYVKNDNGEYVPLPYLYDSCYKVIDKAIEINNGTVLKLGDIDKYEYSIYNKKERYVPVEYNGNVYAFLYYTKYSKYDAKFYFKDTYNVEEFGNSLYKTVPFTYTHKFSAVKN